MADATTTLTGSVSNTNLGSVNKRGDFVTTLDDNGRTIRTKNIRVVAPVGTDFPTSISASRIGNLKVIREDLKLVDTDYVLSSKGSFDADDERGLEAKDFAIYRPVAPEVTF
jgi:hypothetical protein